MGIFKPFGNLFGGFFGGKKTATFQPVKKPHLKPIPRGGGAKFTPIGPATFKPVGDATFEVVPPPPIPTPQTEEQEEQTVQEMLDKQGYVAAEAAYLAGEPHYVISSNVHYFQYFFVYPDGKPQNELIVGFKDGSAYLYEDVSLEEALVFYRAGSAGKAVWDNLRVRGTVFGFQKNYRLVSGNRIWHRAGADSISRHEAIPKSGEPFQGYHPSMNYKGAKGAMGASGIDLGKKGSKKIAYFTPVNAKAGFGKRP